MEEGGGPCFLRHIQEEGDVDMDTGENKRKSPGGEGQCGTGKRV